MIGRLPGLRADVGSMSYNMKMIMKISYRTGFGRLSNNNPVYMISRCWDYSYRSRVRNSVSEFSMSGPNHRMRSRSFGF